MISRASSSENSEAPGQFLPPFWGWTVAGEPMRDFARDLRKNMTDAERRLWRSLRRRQLGACRFRRQAPIGEAIVDFVCFERKLVVELDGGQHATRTDADAARTEWLNSQGFQVLRFWNCDVFDNLDGILEAIVTGLGAGQEGNNTS
jgi:very-short-patch-repair endonuclease